MAVIAHSNPYQSLSRKVGYSVGLENVFRNALMLVDKYRSAPRGLKLSDWNSLVHEGFGRGETAAEHIGNFFTTINLVKIYGKEIHSLYGLDALLMLKARFASQDLLFNQAARLVLLQLLIEADADVFLNCLAANFEREGVRRLLASMVSDKWTALRANVASPPAQEKLWDAVSIRNLPASSASEKSKDAPFGRRTTPLTTAPTRSMPRDHTVEIHDSYLDKILPTRKGWARDLQLLGSDSQNAEARTLLENLGALGMINADGAYRFWPYEQDLGKLRMTYEQLGAKPIDSWQLLQQLVVSLGGAIDLSDDASHDAEIAILLKDLHTLYKAANPAQGALRHQLPVYVAKPVVAAIYFAEQKPVPDLASCIKREIHGAERRFDLTNVRGTEGALIFRN